MTPGKEKDATVRFTIYLTDETRKALRIRAIEDGVSATRLVERLIDEYLGHASAPRGGGR